MIPSTHFQNFIIFNLEEKFLVNDQHKSPKKAQKKLILFYEKKNQMLEKIDTHSAAYRFMDFNYEYQLVGHYINVEQFILRLFSRHLPNLKIVLIGK